MKVIDIARHPYTRLAVNGICAAGHCVIGLLTPSWWFITVGAYYTVLTVTRFSIWEIKRKARGSAELERLAGRSTGILLVVLSFCLIGINILSAIKDRGRVYHEIIMISMALYSFSKITLSVIGMVKAGRSGSPIIKTLRNVAFADAVVSIYTLQRSMLVSFPGMAPGEIQLFNILTGAAVWLIILLLGVNLIGGKQIDMAKSKIVKANEKIARAVTGGYKKVEKGVVDGFRKIEEGVVQGYTKIEDKFVEAYLTKEGESVEEAKARLKKEGK